MNHLQRQNVIKAVGYVLGAAAATVGAVSIFLLTRLAWNSIIDARIALDKDLNTPHCACGYCGPKEAPKPASVVR